MAEGGDDTQAKLRAWLEGRTPDELQALRAYALDQALRARRVTAGGTPGSLRALRDRALAARAEYERGAYDEPARSVPRWAARRAVPSSRLRPGATKQQLRPDEEAALALERVGNGNVFDAPPGAALPRPLARLAAALPRRRRAFAWAVYARPEAAEAALRARWAGRPADEAVDAGAFASDVLRACAAMELTLMLTPQRALPLAEAGAAAEARLARGMARLAGGAVADADRADLKNFVSLFSERRLAGSGLTDAGAARPGASLLLTAGPRGELLAEAITPGTLAERRAGFVGSCRNPLVTGAVFEAFLGADAVDEPGRRRCANGLLWLANGLRLAPAPGAVPPGQLAFDATTRSGFPAPPAEAVEALRPDRPGLWGFADGARMLLGRLGDAAAAAAGTAGGGGGGRPAAQPS